MTWPKGCLKVTLIHNSATLKFESEFAFDVTYNIESGCIILHIVLTSKSTPDVCVEYEKRI